ncbi:unnamed protein product [Acanthosepion pharaonis]|uniref:Uncharacterized protein n=1 Tax=Acanthosepion pharaonis TaxID=158019 RepID=A0A812DGN3_ACAPH|nr:unnamed protein product [Sepia pharaonis]
MAPLREGERKPFGKVKIWRNTLGHLLRDDADDEDVVCGLRLLRDELYARLQQSFAPPEKGSLGRDIFKMVSRFPRVTEERNNQLDARDIRAVADEKGLPSATIEPVRLQRCKSLYWEYPALELEDEPKEILPYGDLSPPQRQFSCWRKPAFSLFFPSLIISLNLSIYLQIQIYHIYSFRSFSFSIYLSIYLSITYRLSRRLSIYLSIHHFLS